MLKKIMKIDISPSLSLRVRKDRTVCGDYSSVDGIEISMCKNDSRTDRYIVIDENYLPGVLEAIREITGVDLSERDRFKRDFTIQFLASYAANIYVDARMSGGHDKLRGLPTEDVVRIAEYAWKEYNERFNL